MTDAIAQAMVKVCGSTPKQEGRQYVGRLVAVVSGMVIPVQPPKAETVAATRCCPPSR